MVGRNLLNPVTACSKSAVLDRETGEDSGGKTWIKDGGAAGGAALGHVEKSLRSSENRGRTGPAAGCTKRAP